MLEGGEVALETNRGLPATSGSSVVLTARTTLPASLDRLVGRSMSFAAVIISALACAPAMGETIVLKPASMTRIGTVDERYQSYNVEMLEVTGGRFWKPYKDIPVAGTAGPASQSANGTGSGGAPADMNPGL